MELKIGGTYQTRDGRKAVIDGVSNLEGYAFCGRMEDEATYCRDWKADGGYWMYDGEVGEDIVAEIHVPTFTMDARATMAMHFMKVYLASGSPREIAAKCATLDADALIAELLKTKE